MRVGVRGWNTRSSPEPAFSGGWSIRLMYPGPLVTWIVASEAAGCIPGGYALRPSPVGSSHTYLPSWLVYPKLYAVGIANLQLVLETVMSSRSRTEPVLLKDIATPYSWAHRKVFALISVE